jgi:hypothetical protein
MKIVFIILISTFFISCSTTKIYMVRHAEKNGTMADADLKNPEGFTRASILKDSLQRITLYAVYSTNTPRTKHTAEPTATSQKLSLNIYANGDSLLDKLLLQKNKKCLVVGHSNTIPQMIRHIGLNPAFEGNIPDNVFDNLFIIIKKWKLGKTSITLMKKKYGSKSP